VQWMFHVSVATGGTRFEARGRHGAMSEPRDIPLSQGGLRNLLTGHASDRRKLG